MTKKVNWQNNERVDKPDMIAGTNDLSFDVGRQLVERFMLPRFPNVASGFRVEIANQVTSPGEITVYNGYAFDRDGSPLINVDEENTSRSTVLLADGQYFLEAYYIETPSDTDARAFWNPKFNNGTDPSGDPRLPGREFAQNVSTRITPDWQIVLPISTTGFDISLNPDSIKIPIAVIQIAGGVVVNATTVPAQTVLAETVLAGVTTIKVFDSRLFPDTFPATLGGAAITVSANDRRNNILSLSAPLAAGHAAGERVVNTSGSPNQFLVDRATPALPTTQSQDARPRFYQGDENRGYALAQNPSSTTAPADRSDTQLQDLKDQVDFLAAQLREMRFGAERDSDIGSLAPPRLFPTTPRYFNRAGSLVGARSITVSIGDGTTSFGDLNTNKFASVTACFQAAISALPSTGGTIFVKGSPAGYVFSAGEVVISNRTVRVVGEGYGVQLKASGATPAVRVTGGVLILENLQVIHDIGATAPGALQYNDGALSSHPVIRASNCLIEGLYTTNASAISESLFEGCLFQSWLSGNHIAVHGDVISTTFINCKFDTTGDNNAATRCTSIGRDADGTAYVDFINCAFKAPALSQVLAEFGVTGVATCERIRFSQCSFEGGGSSSYAISAENSPSNISFSMEDCTSTVTGGFFVADNTVNTLIRNCRVRDVAATRASIRFGSLGNQDITIRDCSFRQTVAGGAGAGASAFLAENLIGATIDNCYFENLDYAIHVIVGNNLNVTNCRSQNDSGRGRAFFIADDVFINTTIANNLLGTYQSAVDGFVAGVRFFSTVDSLRIINNGFNGVGTNTAAVTAAAVFLDMAGGGNRVLIAGNEIRSVNTNNANAAYGIYIGDNVGLLRVANNEINSIGSSSAGAYGMYLAGGTVASVVGNNLFGIGVSTTQQTSGIFVTKGSSNAIGWTVANNVVQGVGFSTSTFTQNNACITFDDCGKRVTITGNVLNPGNAQFYGIRFNSSTLSQVANVAITGNQIGAETVSSCFYGVYVQLNGGKYIVVNSNIINECDVAGISVVSNGTSLTDVNVCTNSIFSSRNQALIGVALTDATAFSITGNKVYFSENTAGGKAGIVMTTATGGVCGSNHVLIQNMSNLFAPIYLTGCADVHVASNQLYVINNASTTAGVKAAAATNCVAYANFYRLPTASTVDFTGLTTTRAYQDTVAGGIVAPNFGVNPTVSTIGMNVSMN